MHLCIIRAFAKADTFHLVLFLEVSPFSYRRGRVATTGESVVRSSLA